MAEARQGQGDHQKAQKRSPLMPPASYEEGRAEVGGEPESPSNSLIRGNEKMGENGPGINNYGGGDAPAGPQDGEVMDKMGGKGPGRDNPTCSDLGKKILYFLFHDRPWKKLLTIVIVSCEAGSLTLLPCQDGEVMDKMGGNVCRNTPAGRESGSDNTNGTQVYIAGYLLYKCPPALSHTTAGIKTSRVMECRMSSFVYGN
ncbi:hypothetical protein Bbelb_204380 [Branchiostoma belcheri]|nr:hypothetical protein Bbelb_204380 [Branchiostoma belcheri]